jgi:outer membrane protein OmpA-like peptidoglycan-associated protein
MIALARRAPKRAPWLMTLADLSLLLLGFFVMIQAAQSRGPESARNFARGLRMAFDGGDASTRLKLAPSPSPLALEANVMTGFAPGQAVLPASPQDIIDWVRDTTGDPRSRLIVRGHADGTIGDVESTTGSGLALASRRAEALASAIEASGAIPAARMRIEANVAEYPQHDPRARRADISITYQP